MKGVSPEAFVADYLVDQTDDHILSDEARRKEVVDDIAYKPPKKSAKKKGGGDDDEDDGEDDSPSNAVGRRLKEIKAVMSNLPETIDDDDDDNANDEEEDERPAKKSKTDDVEAYAKAMRLYSKMKNDDLKAVLRWNLGYATSGNKDVLLLR
jgi:hypothetical protein